MSTYTLHTPITQENINRAQSLANEGRLGDMYDYLASFGDRYSILAKGVVEGDTLSGVAAIEFMKNTAEQQGRTLTEADIDAIRADMATGYLDTLQIILNRNGTVDREITAKEAQAFHDQVFEDAQLGKDAWTLNTPFDIFGEQGAQEYWEKTLDAAGDLSKEAVLAGGLHQGMAFWSSMAGDEQRGQMRSWSSRFDNFGAAWNLTLVFGGQGIDEGQEWLTDFLTWWDPAGIMPESNSAYLNAHDWAPRRDPLTLDLDGDGLETVGIDTARPVHFDHNADGVKTATGWVASDDGFLVLDRNENGAVDSGAELFGDSTVLADGSKAADGFGALAEQDSNNDGKVDDQDANWSDIRIWRDLNQNGVSEAGELQSMENVGIASLDVEAQSHRQTLSNGNRIADLGRFTWSTGESGEIESVVGRSADIDLAENSFYREFTETVPLTQEARALPSMRGSGTVRDMREAASLSPTFAQTLSNFNQAATRDAQLAQLDGLVSSWASTSTRPTSIELAQDAGYKLIYLAPGMSAGDYENYLPYLENDMAPPSDMSDEDLAHLAELKAEQQHLATRIGALERFNGQPFVQIEASSVVLGSGRHVSVGTGSSIVGVKRAYVSISSAQKQILNP